MTEAEWFNGKETRPMLRYLLGLRPDELRVQDIEKFPACRTSDRKLRLFACACYHRIAHLLPDPRAAVAVEAAERAADGCLSLEEFEMANLRIREDCEELEPRWRESRGAEREALLPTHEALALGMIALWKAQKAAYYAASNAHLAFAPLSNPGVAIYDRVYGASQRAEEQAQTDLLRDIFGNPFRPLAFDAEWRTTTVLALANHIYESRDFSAMPILADALSDAGCPDDVILNHCRDANAIHVRGCFVVDLCLGKE
jgi:hypothetical protein